MDFDDNNDNSDTNNNGAWEWQGDEYSLQQDTNYDVPHCLWDDVNADEENLDHLFDEQTPMKDCLDFSHQVSIVGDDLNKDLGECTETSQMKRRRMLHFTSVTNNANINDEHVTSVAGGSQILEWNGRCSMRVHDDAGTDNRQGLLATCRDEREMHCSINEMDTNIQYDDQVDVSEFYNLSPQMETDPVQKAPVPASIKIYKGKKSYLKAPRKLTSSIAYPFALIKPCGVQGDVTLKDINQRIHAPPPSRSRNGKDQDPSSPYPTSAFSGKPVVVKTKICTEGGKGSITIMRTKG